MKISRDLQFYALLVIALSLISISYELTPIVSWICLIFAAYSAIGNDSIQTLGTFLSSNSKVHRFLIFLFIAGIFVATILYGYFSAGDAAFGRLNNIAEPQKFSFWQAISPLVLILMTHLKIPVSTTFLLLAVFANNETISAMIQKSMIGYLLAFICAIIIFGVLFFPKYLRKDLNVKHLFYWRAAQWCTTAFLWSSWLMQDTANILIFLPRHLNLYEVLSVCLIGSATIAVLIYFRGGRIQSIVTEKQDVTDVRAATLIDFTLAFILLYFKQLNSIPMSTTWVFLGLLAGRESILTVLATWHHDEKLPIYLRTLKLVIKDMCLAAIGMAISLLLVYLANT